MIKESKISNIGDIKPIVNAVGNDPSKIKFGNVFADPYATTFLTAKRKSGKTSVLAEILKKQGGRNTCYWIFCPTHEVDSSWIEILKNLREKNNVVNVFESIMDGKVNQLDKIINSLVHVEKEDEEQPKPKVKKLIKDYDEEEDEVKKPKKEKKIAPEHIFVFDDISHELKNPAIYKLLKNGRHIKSAVYISFQYPNDVQPQGWKNCSYALCFKSFSDDKLEHIHKHMDLTIPFEKFKEIYDYVHKNDKYDFLYIDVRNQNYRKNFNKELSLE
jgi:hypothetical protein